VSRAQLDQQELLVQQACRARLAMSDQQELLVQQARRGRKAQPERLAQQVSLAQLAYKETLVASLLITRSAVTRHTLIQVQASLSLIMQT
jgi:hypothetical protein